MDKDALLRHLETIDSHLAERTQLCVYGSAALILLGEEDRTSQDIDVAAPYSQAHVPALRAAAAAAGLLINPGPTDAAGDHIKWIGPLRLCLPPPPEDAIVLWEGRKLRVMTVSPAGLIASKLIRYDEIDRADIQFLFRQSRCTHGEVERAVAALPGPFATDPVIRDNLANLKVDLQLWSGTP